MVQNIRQVVGRKLKAPAWSGLFVERRHQTRLCLLLAHRDISLRCQVRPLSGHSRHGHACCWLDLGRE
jgi:hypothetical protein